MHNRFVLCGVAVMIYLAMIARMFDAKDSYRDQGETYHEEWMTKEAGKDKNKQSQKQNHQISEQQNYPQPEKQNHQKSEPQNYQQPEKQNYRKSEPQNYQQAEKQTYQKSEQQNYQQPEKQNHQKSEPQNYQQPEKQNHQKSEPQNYQQPEKQNHQKSEPQNYQQPEQQKYQQPQPQKQQQKQAQTYNPRSKKYCPQRMHDDWCNTTKYPRQTFTTVSQQYVKQKSSTKPRRSALTALRGMAAKLGKAVSNIFGRSKKQTTKKKSRTKRNVDDEYSDDLVCTRKEIHCLTPGELKGLSMTLNRWHHEPIDEESGRTGHEMFIGYHRFAEAPGAHFGPCFIPWHRICLARAEQAWKNMGCGYSCIPYLDWSLLVGLHLPADSCLFSDDYFGASNGDVTTGIAGDWKIFYPECGERLNRDCLRTSDARDYLITEEVEYEILEEGYTYGRLCYSAHPKLEMNHGYFHSMMGGQMDMLSCAPHDPFFWMHHAGVDRLYQKARDRHEEEGTPVWAEYPDPASRHMGYDDPCLPFDTHSDPCDCGTGLDEEYEDLAQYEEPPKRCWVDSDCACKDNPYDCLVAALWCKNTSYYEEDWRCTSKIKIGGNCRGFRDSSCFQETKCGYNRAYCHSRTQVCTC